MPAFGHGDAVCTSVFPSGSAVQIRAVLLPVSSLALHYPLGFSLPAGSLSWEVRGHPPGMQTWALSSHLFNVQTMARSAVQRAGWLPGCEAGVGWPSPAR